MRSALLVLLAAASALGCAGVPQRFSPRSAASVEARAAPATDVSRSMREDPPLPGAAAGGWAGLAVDLSGPLQGHAGHAAHGTPSAGPMDHAAMGHGSVPPAPGPESAGSSAEGAHDGH